MTHVTCRLTAKNRDRLRNPTLGNRVRATFLVSSYWVSQWRALAPTRTLTLLTPLDLNNSVSCSAGLPFYPSCRSSLRGGVDVICQGASCVVVSRRQSARESRCPASQHVIRDRPAAVRRAGMLHYCQLTGRILPHRSGRAVLSVITGGGVLAQTRTDQNWIIGDSRLSASEKL